MEAVNPLAGTLSGAFILIICVLSMEPIRRRTYDLFVAVHCLWPLVYLFGCLHTLGSETPTTPVSMRVLPITLLHHTCASDHAFASLVCPFCHSRHHLTRPSSSHAAIRVMH